jgi:hypothetical protein
MRKIAFDLDEKLGIGKPDPVANGRAKHIGIGGAREV